MPFESVILLSMILVFGVGVFWLKLPSGVALALGAIAGALVGGYGIPVRHLVEGMFGFLEPALIVATAIVFMRIVTATGALGALNRAMVQSLRGRPTLLLVLTVFFIMLPGMLTGLSSVCVLTTGALVAPTLLAMNIPAAAVGAFIALAAVLGEIAPPINIPVMIIGGGADMPYIGFEGPLLLLAVPLAILLGVYVRVRYVRVRSLTPAVPMQPSFGTHGVKMFFPLAVVIGLMVAIRAVPATIPDIGVPLIFTAGIVSSFGTGNRFPFVATVREGIRDAIPVMSILAGVGMFVQVMTLTGVRGMMAVGALEVPRALLYVGVGLIMPAIGSAYASASVIGVPLLFALLGRNEIVVASGLSLIASLADLMPPPTILCVFAGQVVGEKNPFRILRHALPFMVVMLAAGLTMVILANAVGSLFGLN
jgi:GntP family gluconate:H+ symporter